MIEVADRKTSLETRGGDVVVRAKEQNSNGDSSAAKITRSVVLVIVTIGTTVGVLTYLRKDMRDDMAASYYGKSDGDVLKTRVDGVSIAVDALARSLEKFGDQQDHANEQLMRVTNANASLAADVTRVQSAQKELQDGMTTLTRELLELKASKK